jgi:succinate dehydrogenase / fumarate reductase cytochrome b subunit
MFQTLGANSPNTDRLWRGVATASAVVLFGGFSAVPLAVLLGVVRL